MADCGIDFGTTNSLVSCVVGGKARALMHEGRPHPSVSLVSRNTDQSWT